MRRLIIVSNRLPVTVTKRKGELRLHPSVGGLVTGLRAFYQEYDSRWVGWAGIATEQIHTEDRQHLIRRLRRRRCYPVFLTRTQVQRFYYGFCNRTIWPLFHYFSTYAEFDDTYWQAYQRVNEQFAEAVMAVAGPDDVIWIHDYHLMLLPRLLREIMPNAMIGFFLHIPFPSFEIFRLLPWRQEILEGLLGADLVGMHTYDYVIHFLSSVRHLIGYDHELGQIHVQDRLVQVDAFPMGIEYETFRRAVRAQTLRRAMERIRAKVGARKIILSIDRLDYTKGIPQRLRAFDAFLEKYPEYRGKVTLILVGAPSRVEIEQYQQLKDEVDQLVGAINGKYGTLDWIPVWYISRALSREELLPLYRIADVMMVTPYRDGMNLVAKEYLAARTNHRGVLILSEMAGAAWELGEALNLTVREQRERIQTMRRRLQRYDILRWAQDFMDRLMATKHVQTELQGRRLTDTLLEEIVARYVAARTRLILLDYDGTLIPFAPRPEQARPTPRILHTLRNLARPADNCVVLISGRDRHTLSRWFGALPIDLVAEHGVWIREAGQEWQLIEPLRNDWKQQVRPLLELFADRTPGAFVEEKEYSLVWHYRRSPPEIGEARARELKNALMQLIITLNLGVLEGNKVIEVKNAGIHKGRAVLHWLQQHSWDFVLAVGDDRTDEDMFEVLPEDAYSIRVGFGASRARFHVRATEEVHRLLDRLLIASGVDAGTH